jgi:hypothetical protein
MERNVSGFFNHILLPALGCAILALNVLVGSYHEGGGNVNEFLKGVLVGFTFTIWLVCLYNWGIVISIVKGKSRRSIW